jgi:uncharacterized protein YbbC (DUF1343 family)
VNPTPRTNASVPASGIDKLLVDGDRLAALRRRRVGLLTNAACRTADGRQSAHALGDALAQGSRPGLACLFAPEHGPAADHEAGAAVADQRADRQDVISLYGARRAPTPDHLALIDTLIIDLRDVGVRCYTYATTAALAAEAALDAGVETIICNRPNPLGPVTAGPPLDPNFRSFLAYFDTPFVHGETIGALVAGALKDHPRAEDLTVIECDANLGTPWVPPSPSLQSPDAVQFYPGLVLFEGTNLSEGRGIPPRPATFGPMRATMPVRPCRRSGSTSPTPRATVSASAFGCWPGYRVPTGNSNGAPRRLCRSAMRPANAL